MMHKAAKEEGHGKEGKHYQSNDLGRGIPNGKGRRTFRNHGKARGGQGKLFHSADLSLLSKHG
jgi:hypothetical protein